MKLRRLLKMGVLGDDDKAAGLGMIPGLCIAGFFEPDRPNVRRPGKELVQRLEQTM